MNEQLHPLTLGEILDRTAQLYRSRFLVYFGIGVIPAGTVLVFAAAIFVFFAWVGSECGRWSPCNSGKRSCRGFFWVQPCCWRYLFALEPRRWVGRPCATPLRARFSASRSRFARPIAPRGGAAGSMSGSALVALISGRLQLQ